MWATSTGVSCVRERGEADLAAAIDHADRVVHRIRRARALDHIVDALAAVEPAHRFDGILVAHVDDMIGAELAADFQPIVARAGEDHGRGAQRLRHRDAEKTDRARAGDDDALAGHQAAELGQPVHRRAGGHHQRRLLVRHGVGNGDQRVDVVDLVFAEAAVGGEAVGAVALVDVAVIEPVVVARRCTCPRGSACTGRSRHGSRP